MIMVAGALALASLIGAKLCTLLQRHQFRTTTKIAYECGFKGERLDKYITEKYNLVSVYLLFELLIVYCLTIFLL